jgi:hypothetical protein
VVSSGINPYSRSSRSEVRLDHTVKKEDIRFVPFSCVFTRFVSLCVGLNRRGEVCCVLHHLSLWYGTCGVCGFYTLGSGFVPRAFAYFTVNLIVSISLCSILPYNLITILIVIVISY